jgi:integrase
MPCDHPTYSPNRVEDVFSKVQIRDLLLRQGVNPKFVQELLGHGDVSLTLNTYSHVLPDMGDAAAVAMDAVLG